MSEPRRAIVTGGGSGIGRATALALARAGCDVGVTFRSNQAGGERTVADIGGLGRAAAAVRLDLGDPASAAAAIDELAGRLGGLDVLVNNAGINRRALTQDESVDGFRHTLDVDLLGPWACAQAAARHMLAAGRGGRIVNVTSILAFAPLSGGAAYCAAKAGLEAATKVMALELAPTGVTVNAVAPGHTATPMNYEPGEL